MLRAPSRPGNADGNHTETPPHTRQVGRNTQVRRDESWRGRGDPRTRAHRRRERGTTSPHKTAQRPLRQLNPALPRAPAAPGDAGTRVRPETCRSLCAAASFTAANSWKRPHGHREWVFKVWWAPRVGYYSAVRGTQLSHVLQWMSLENAVRGGSQPHAQTRTPCSPLQEAPRAGRRAEMDVPGCRAGQERRTDGGGGRRWHPGGPPFGVRRMS